MLVRLSTLMCVCVGGGGGGGGGGWGDCSQGHNFYKLKHRSFKQFHQWFQTNTAGSITEII